MRQHLVVALLESRADVNVLADAALDLVAKLPGRHTDDASEDPGEVVDGLEAHELGDLLELVVGPTDELLGARDPTMQEVAHRRNANLSRESVADVTYAEARVSRQRRLAQLLGVMLFDVALHALHERLAGKSAARY